MLHLASFRNAAAKSRAVYYIKSPSSPKALVTEESVFILIF